MFLNAGLFFETNTFQSFKSSQMYPFKEKIRFITLIELELTACKA